jgi:membrane-bound lytic murein transglycosylase D
LRSLISIAGGLLLALAAGGCATPKPPPPPTRPSEPAARETVEDRLEAARDDYHEGVRAYVGEEPEEAERLLNRCQERLAFAGEWGDFTEMQARDAQALRSKSAYFLEKIAEGREVVLEERPATEVTEEPETPTSAEWTVVHGKIEPVRNRHVDRWLRYFRGDGRAVFASWLARKSLYEPVCRAAFARHGLPPGLVYHAMIESGFNPRAYSWAHAVGLWQFIRGTARTYGLRCDWWVDERRDPDKATEAAAKYLTALYEEFGDWELALAAYNVGEARIRKQIRRQGTRDYWKLKLPRETRNHVPKFYAAMILGTDPERNGFEAGGPAPPTTEAVEVDFCVDFEVLGECAGVSAETLASLNPSLIRRCTPPDEEGFRVLVPAGTAERTRQALASLPAERRVRWAHHRVRRGDTLSHLAERYGTSVRAISEANRLRSRHFLSVGQDLLIPSGRKSGGPLPNFATGGGSGPEGTERIRYTVRRGDTLSEIAMRYGTSTRKLRRWNRIGKYIHPGDRLTIHVAPRQLAYRGSGGSGTFTVRVRKGDTLWDIARLHGVSVKALLKANNLRKNDLIRPGDLIRVPNS